MAQSSKIDKNVEEPIDPSIIVIKERPYMWAVYAAFIVGIALLTFVVMELLFGP